MRVVSESYLAFDSIDLSYTAISFDYVSVKDFKGAIRTFGFSYKHSC